MRTLLAFWLRGRMGRRGGRVFEVSCLGVDMEHQSRTVDEVIAALAARAHGIVTRKKLLETRISPEEIRTRLLRGSLIEVYPGVYRVGHAAPSVHATYMAAVLAC